MLERQLFDAAMEITEPFERSLFLDSACQGNFALREHVERMIKVQGQLGDFSAIRRKALVDPCGRGLEREYSDVNWTVSPLGTHRRRRHGNGFSGRADQARSSESCRQDCQARDGQRAGDRSLGSGTTSPCPDGSSEHRQDPRCRGVWCIGKHGSRIEFSRQSDIL